MAHSGVRRQAKCDAALKCNGYVNPVGFKSGKRVHKRTGSVLFQPVLGAPFVRRSVIRDAMMDRVLMDIAEPTEKRSLMSNVCVPIVMPDLATGGVIQPV